MIKAMTNEEFDDFNVVLICKCPKCGKEFLRQLNADDVCTDDAETRSFFDCYCCSHYTTKCPECGHVFWDDDDCLEEDE